MIKLKTIELKVDAMLDTRASKNLLFETLVPQEDQKILVQPVELVQYNQQKLILIKYISNVPIIINNITLVLPQTYLVRTISLYPFILGLNFVHSLRGITIQNNQVNFHPKTTTIFYTNMENVSNKNHNATSHQINKVEAQRDSIINDYLEQLINANRLKNFILEAKK